MNQIAWSKLKRMTVADFKVTLPVEIVADGQVVCRCFSEPLPVVEDAKVDASFTGSLRTSYCMVHPKVAR